MSRPTQLTFSDVVYALGVVVLLLGLAIISAKLDLWYKKKIIKEALQELKQEKNSAESP